MVKKSDTYSGNCCFINGDIAMTNKHDSDNADSGIEIKTDKSFGQRLKKAREAKQISIESIANQLRIKKDRIVELENDDYKKMPGLVYARGYLRSYAQLLGIPIDEETLAAFEQVNVPEVEQFIPKPEYFDDKPVASKHYLVRWVSYSIVFLFMVMVVLWWRDHHENKFKTPGPAESVTTEILHTTTPPTGQTNGAPGSGKQPMGTFQNMQPSGSQDTQQMNSEGGQPIQKQEDMNKVNSNSSSSIDNLENNARDSE